MSKIKLNSDSYHKDRIKQNFLEYCADMLDDDEVVYHQQELGISDPEVRKKSELHIRMVNAAYREYEKTMFGNEVPDREEEMREALNIGSEIIDTMYNFLSNVEAGGHANESDLQLLEKCNNYYKLLNK